MDTCRLLAESARDSGLACQAELTVEHIFLFIVIPLQMLVMIYSCDTLTSMSELSSKVASCSRISFISKTGFCSYVNFNHTTLVFMFFILFVFFHYLHCSYILNLIVSLKSFLITCLLQIIFNVF